VVTAVHKPPATAAADGGLSGVDLAKVALRAARAAAANGATSRPAPARRTAWARRSDGREPAGLAAVLEGLMAARAWDTPTAGANVVADWDRIAPDLAGHVHAAGFDAAAGVLQLRPVSPAWATHLRLRTAAIVQRITEHTGDRTVREIRILPPGPASSPSTTGARAPAATIEAGTATAQEPAAREPSTGYRHARDAHRAAVPEQQLAPGIRAAIERQDQALAWHREPEEVFRAVLVDQDQEDLQTYRGRGADAYQRARQQAARDRAARSLPSIGTGTPRPSAGQELRNSA
jgi:predicted nucleic acid-binding Zn ribbon protein